MSPLRKHLKRPKPYLALLLTVGILALADSFRAPDRQATGHAYVAAVRLYQRIGRPALAGHVRCRYEPTCSEYSIEAVERFGIRRGLEMTLSRLRSCTSDVPLGTVAPVTSEPTTP